MNWSSGSLRGAEHPAYVPFLPYPVLSYHILYYPTLRLIQMARISSGNTSAGTCSAPSRRIRFLPSFCFSSSLRFRVTSPACGAPRAVAVGWVAQGRQGCDTSTPPVAVVRGEGVLAASRGGEACASVMKQCHWQTNAAPYGAAP